jgi:PKD repeat protein
MLTFYYANGNSTAPGKLKPSLIWVISFLLLCGLLPPSSYALAPYTLEVELQFSAPDDPEKTHVGYRLYIGDTVACETTDPLAASLTCDVQTEDGTYNFYLTALYSDLTESPKSSPFPFTFGTPPEPPVDGKDPPPGTGAYTITYTWNSSASAVVGYRMYMNETQLCETTDLAGNTLSCLTDLVNSSMTFSITSFDASGIESAKSNFLTLEPSDIPGLFEKKTTVFKWQYTDGPSNAGGFQIFSNAGILCQTSDPSARDLTCQIDTLSSTTTFTLAAVDSQGALTSFSNALVYSPSGTTVPPEPPLEELASVITAGAITGTTPLAITFSGASSTGDITSYSWDFGDGDQGSGVSVSHTYSIPGSYSVSLDVTDSSGASALSSLTVTAEEATTTPEPPTAVLTSSTAAGDAPLDVSFDGSASITPNPPMLSYDWDFGDGSKATGQTTSHIFTISGTYNTELAVSDTAGLTDTETTPVIVIGNSGTNEQPVALISANPTQGDAPLVVSFDASSSYDPDGTITAYNWDFGDGTSATGPVTQHTYSSAAVYTVSLQVTDDKGETGISAKSINATGSVPDFEYNIEVGEISVDQQWVQVLFSNAFTSPVIIAGPPAYNDPDPVLIRIRNVTSEGFEIRLQEWDYQDDTHAPEIFSFIVLEAGVYTLNNGMKVEAGNFTGSTTFQEITLQQAYTSVPIILTQVVSDNELDAVTGRVANITSAKFEYKMQEQQTNKKSHVGETISYLAWEPGTGELSTLMFEAGTTGQNVSNNWHDLSFQSQFPELPLFLGGMQTNVDADPASPRINGLTETSVQVQVAEEQSKDTEVTHAAEVIGYLAISATQPTTEPPVTPSPADHLFNFTWSYEDSPVIAGFRIYLNGVKLCETMTPTDREIACSASLLGEAMTFSIAVVFTDGTESTPSNILSISPSDSLSLFGIQAVSYSWSFDESQESLISGFKVYNKDQFVCETSDTSLRTLTCETPISTAGNTFIIKVVDLAGVETTISSLDYTP